MSQSELEGANLVLDGKVYLDVTLANGDVVREEIAGELVLRALELAIVQALDAWKRANPQTASSENENS